jgi:hypothetical protein
VREYPEVTPFTMWFKPDSAVDVMAGDLVVLSAFEMSDLKSLFAAKGVSITWDCHLKDLFPVFLDSNYLQGQQEFELRRSSIGDYHRLKLMYAFLATESYVDICSFLISPEAAAQFKRKIGPLQSE